MNEINMGLTEQRAIEYARWLAYRDGIHIGSGCKAEAVWGNYKHIRSVEFSTAHGIRVTIDIPNWDWEPTKEAA